jgi:hypothetical protein
MSSLFSDPPFSRGTTLLAGETIDLDSNGNPIAGTEIVGQIKAFQDIHPVTKQRLSSRLVYCVAARYKGTAIAQADMLSTNRGTAYAFDTAAVLTEFTSAVTATNVADGRAFGVLDEYLSTALRPNDICWLVIKGPCEVKKITSAAVNAGVAVEISATAGSIQTANTGVKIGQQIAGANVAQATAVARVNLFDTTANVSE